jgi:hypothetical protein
MRAFTMLAAIAFAAPALAQQPARKTIWDLDIGARIAALPPPIEFRAYACGAKGGTPRQPLKSFADFARCSPEANGLREVVFEYDDELEYIARARDLDREISRFAGTTEHGYNILPSVLFDASGVLRALRMVTDPRPDYRRDVTAAETATRAEAYKFGGVMAARFEIEPARDCKSTPPADGESAVGGVFVKLDCDKLDAAERRRFALTVRYLRKPGQTDRDPRNAGQLTVGQFESWAMLEIRRGE